MKKYLLFDLDGTLTDPKLGITSCVQYALKEFGIEEPDLDKLEPFIGPPLKDSFMEFYHMSEEQAEAAVAKYRERFQDVGLFENEVYAGIPKMLHTLQSKGFFLAVASSKPTVFVERILEHFNIRKNFVVVVGSELDGTRVNKDEVVQEALHQLFKGETPKRDQVYMIGDRRFDVEGAKAMHIESVGVTYGYGGMKELKEAGADYIVQSVEELEQFLLRGTEETEPNKKGLTFMRVWAMVYAFLMFVLVRAALSNGLIWLLIEYANDLKDTFLGSMLIWDEAGGFLGYSGDLSTAITAIGYAGGAISIWSVAKVLIRKPSSDMKLTHLKKEKGSNLCLMGVATVGAVVGLNLLLELLNVTEQSEAYQSVASSQYASNFLLGMLCYGLITPVAEELLFRGVIYNYLRRFMQPVKAVLAGALCFGIYHMNSVQGIYGFLMGCLIIYMYEYVGSFKVPVLLHITANVLAYCLSYAGVAVSGLVSWPVCIIALAAAIVSLGLLGKQKSIF